MVSGFGEAPIGLTVVKHSLISTIFLLLNSGGGDIKFWVDEVRSGFGVDETIDKFEFDRWWLLLTMFDINAGGNVGDFCGDFGLFKMVAYNEPSNGPWVCNESAKRAIKTQKY